MVFDWANTREPFKLRREFGRPLAIHVGTFGNVLQNGWENPSGFNAATRNPTLLRGGLRTSGGDPCAIQLGPVTTPDVSTITMVVSLWIHSVVGNDTGIFGTRTTNTTTNSIQINHKNNTGQMAFVFPAGVAANNTAPIGMVHNLCATVGNKRSEGWQNGKLMVAGNAASSKIMDIGAFWRLGRYFYGDGASRTNDSTYFLAIAAEGAISSDLAQRLSVDPWLSFINEELYFPFGDAVVGGASNAPRYYHRTQMGMS